MPSPKTPWYTDAERSALCRTQPMEDRQAFYERLLEQEREDLAQSTSMAEDWAACKQAYDDAVFFTGVSKGWAEGTTQGWRDYLAKLATAFESKYGVEFNPKKPITEKEAA